MVTVDAVVFRHGGNGLELLVVRRGREPFAGQLALPGGFVEEEEDLGDAAKRELAEETGLDCVSLTQLRAFGTPGRDPRGRNISVAFVGLLEEGVGDVRGGDDASEALWVDARRLPTLAFDHVEIAQAGLDWLDRRGSSA
jgi:8-oxo-dGTP diphosphatase